MSRRQTLWCSTVTSKIPSLTRSTSLRSISRKRDLQRRYTANHRIAGEACRSCPSALGEWPIISWIHSDRFQRFQLDSTLNSKTQVEVLGHLADQQWRLQDWDHFPNCWVHMLLRWPSKEPVPKLRKYLCDRRPLNIEELYDALPSSRVQRLAPNRRRKSHETTSYAGKAANAKLSILLSKQERDFEFSLLKNHASTKSRPVKY